MDDDATDAALAHQQELESRRWQEELTNDAGYVVWLAELAAEAASRTKVNHGDHGEREFGR